MAKTALVTGGGRGIGAGIVDALAAEGWNVVFCGRTEPEKYAERVSAIEQKFGVGALYLRADIAEESAPELLLDKTLERFGALNALVRTTVAFTRMEGSKAFNVIPPDAWMAANIRLNPEDSSASALERIRRVVNDPDIEISGWETDEPSPISRTDCEGWRIVSESVSDTWNCASAPYLMVQCSDSRHYGLISDRVYRFSAMDMSAEERHMIHGNNERIRLEAICRAVEFFMRVMKQL